MYDKKEAMFAKAPIILNGITDRQGDVVLTSEDVKKIKTNFDNQENYDVLHERVPIPDVSIEEKYINEVDEEISGVTIPAGSWIVVLRIDNPEIKEKILDNQITGISLWSDVEESCKLGLSGQIKYKDLKDAECVIPKFISFVDSPATGVVLHIMDYPVYISKRYIMTNEEKDVNLLEKIAAHLGIKNDAAHISKEETPAEEPVEKENPPEVEEKEPETEISKAETEVDVKTETVTKEVMDKAIADAVAPLEARIKKLESSKDDTKEDEGVSKEEEPESESESNDEEPKIVKSSKPVGHTPKKEVKAPNYYEMSGRDEITGCKIRE